MVESITISDQKSGAIAKIAPSLGMNCYEFIPQIENQAISVIDSPDSVLEGNLRPSSYGIPILFPFPNRIASGKFTWEDKDYQLPLTPGRPHSLHGFCLDRAWRIVEQVDDFVVGEFQLSQDAPDRLEFWPADYRIQLRYRVAENRLEAQFLIHNPDSKPLPWGLGTHPYFKIPLGANSSPEQTTFSAQVFEHWETVECIPTGKRVDLPYENSLRAGVNFGSQHFDDVFTGWESDGETLHCSIIDQQAGIEMNQASDGRLFRELVVFTPKERNAICLEPYTCVTDAINLEASDISTGLQILEPGESVQTWVAIQINRVMV